MNASLLLLLALAVATTSATSVENGYGGSPDDAQYEYHHYVKDDYGNNYGKQETRQGRRIDGSYYVFLPDNRLQKVYYYVDGDSGFVADVNYEGEAHYDNFGTYGKE